MFKKISPTRTDIALLLLRTGLGFAFIIHGWPKFAGGPEGWVHLGTAMRHVGINWLPVFWGFMAMTAEFFGGMCLVLGIGVRISSGLLLIVMLVAGAGNIRSGYGLEGVMELVEISGGLAALLCAGGGRLGVAV